MTTTVNGIPLNSITGDGVKANEIDVAASKLKIAGTAFTGTARDLNLSAKSSTYSYFDDFLGDTLLDELTVTVGGGTGNAAALSAGKGGRLSLKTASDDGAFTANATSWSLAPLDWRADSGGLIMEARIQFDVVATGYCFIGFTDVAPGTTHEQPIFLTTTAIDSDASNACGVCFDADGTTKTFFHGGVKADTDTTPVYASGPVVATYYTVRVEVSAAGAVQGFIDGVPIGSPVADAVTVTTPLCPVIVLANRSAAAVTALVDYVAVQATR